MSPPGALDEARVRALRQALLDHVAIFFRDQELAPPQLLALAGRFGEIAAYPFVKSLPECPLVLPIVKEPEDRANFGGIWHTDTAYPERPALGTMLYAHQTPAGRRRYHDPGAGSRAAEDGEAALPAGVVSAEPARHRGRGRLSGHAQAVAAA